MTENEENLNDNVSDAATEEVIEQAEPETATQAETNNETEKEADEIKKKTDKQDAEIAQLKDNLLRTAAEYENHRKRTAKEKLELRADIITNVVNDFLPVLDNLERALANDCTDENYKKGVEMIYNSFMETLAKLGVTVIESDGAVFDPSCHMAVQKIEDPEKESGTVAATFAKGYKINDKIIRFAMVAVVS